MRRVITAGCLTLLNVGATASRAADPTISNRLHDAMAAALTCPKKQMPDEIIVCGERVEDSKYRIASAHVPEYGTRASQSPARERNALLDYDAGGTGTCSNVGAWGAWGCLNKDWKAAQEQAAGTSIKGGILYKPAY